MVASREDHQRLTQLDTLLRRVKRRGIRGLEAEELRELPRLYRYASSLHARLKTQGNDPATLAHTSTLIGGAHAVLYHGHGELPETLWKRFVRVYFVDSPRALRAEWRLLCSSLVVFYGLALVSYLAVSRQLELAFTLFDPNVVANEIAQLRALEPGEKFRGNFTFGMGESPLTASSIMMHNIKVSILFFGAGLLAPLFLLILTLNGLMLGTYLGVASHWDQAASINSILWCHGTLELQAIVISGLAGMVLLRAWIAPGVWSRAHAMRLESRRAVLVLAPMFPMLICAGMIEGFISPHAPFGARITVAVVTGLAFLYWLLFAGRERAESATE